MRILSTVLLLLLLFAGFRLAAQAAEPTVYITETGRRYHREGCAYLERTRIPLALAEAVELGYTPCRACIPPAPSGRSKAPAKPPELYRVNVEGLASYRRVELGRLLRGVVVRHIDGDTVYVSLPRAPRGLANYESVRLLGVDAPETRHPRKPVQLFGKEASEFTRGRLLNRAVYLAFDWNLRDEYGRLLAYIYLPDGSCHNADLVAEGFAHAYTRFPFQFLDEFRRLEREARERGKGLWGP